MTAALLFACLLTLSLSAQAKGRALSILLLPAEDSHLMFRQFLPVKQYLEEHLDRPVELIMGSNYEASLESVGQGKVDLAYLDPSAYCVARHRFGVEAMAKVLKNGQPEYRSVLVARKSSALEKIADCKGRSLALGNIHSSGSYLMPLAMFQEVGLSLEDFSRVGYLQKEDQVALSVLVGDFEVGALSLSVAKRYAGYGLKIIKRSEPIPQYALCASPNMDKQIRSRLRKALIGYRPGKYQIISFAPADDQEFNIVRIMLKNTTGQDYITYPEGTLKLGLLPLYSPITLDEMFSPLAEYLSRRTGREFRLVIPKDFEEYVSLVEDGGVDFAYQNPYVYLLLDRRTELRPLALTVSPEPEKPRASFRGAIIIRKDSAIDRLEDLKGKRILVVSNKSAGGYWFEKLLLRQKGIEIDQEATIAEGKRHEEVILGVYRGRADAGFVREAALTVARDIVDMSSLEVLAYTPYYPNWPFAAMPQVEAGLAEDVQRALIEVPGGHMFKRARISGFTKADQESLKRLEDKVAFE